MFHTSIQTYVSFVLIIFSPFLNLFFSTVFQFCFILRDRIIFHSGPAPGQGAHMEYNRKAHSVYLLTYHIVFVTKYRRPVISDEIGYFMKNHAAYLCGRFGGELVSAETDEDHIHLLVSMPPDVAPSRLVATLKTQLSKEVRAEYTEHVRKYLWGDAPFWSNSYFIATTGTTVMEKVKEYIENQRTEEHKRKYVKSGRYVKKRNWRDVPGNSSPTDA